MKPTLSDAFFHKFNSLSFLLLLGRVLAEPEMMVPSRAPVHGASHRPGLVGSNGNHHDNAIAFPRARNEKQRIAIVLLSPHESMDPLPGHPPPSPS